MVLHDSHIHVGQFRDLYSTPQLVLDFLTQLGVDKFAVSSSSTTCKSSNQALDEIKEIIRLGGDRIIPVLWINPEWVNDGTLNTMLTDTVQWKCLKIHGYFSKWENDPKLIPQIVDCARKMNVPLLLHTGGCEASDCGSYLKIIKDNPDVKFILAHSRPVDQAINVMNSCKNAWADTAFTPVEDIEKMIKARLSDRMLWGTDYPLHNVFYKDKNANTIILDKLDKVRNFTTTDQFESITSRNFEQLFL